MKPNILVVGYAHDTQTKHQIKVLQALGANVHVAPPSVQPGKAFGWWSGGGRVGELDLNEVDGALVRCLPPSHPQASAFVRSETGALDWGNWFQSNCIQRDCSDSMLGLLLTYEALGVPMFNAPSKSLMSRRKPFQADLIRRLGCPFPDTLVTNSPGAAKQFMSDIGETIVKPASGGALTMDANELTDEELARIKQAPAIFQRRIVGDDIRVMVLDGEVVSAVAIDVPEGTIDFRGDTTYSTGRASYTEIDLPTTILEGCQRITHALSLRFGGIDLKHTAEGEFFFLECNNSPIYLDVERKLQHPISERLCRRVVDEARTYRRMRAPLVSKVA